MAEEIVIRIVHENPSTKQSLPGQASSLKPEYVGGDTGKMISYQAVFSAFNRIISATGNREIQEIMTNAGKGIRYTTLAMRAMAGDPTAMIGLVATSFADMIGSALDFWNKSENRKREYESYDTFLDNYNLRSYIK